MRTTITETDLRPLLAECCRIGFAPIEEYHGAERDALVGFLPSARTVIVIAHHVQDSLEWTWLRFTAARNGVTCPADLHCLVTAERVAHRLESEGGRALVLPYPGECGLMFKTIALPTRLGCLGDNYLFMSRDWGPWIHLRVILTNEAIGFERPEPEAACNHCGDCLDACPAGAFPDGTFNGLACRHKMREMGQRASDGAFVFECELCLRACPVGRQPQEVTVRFKDNGNSPPTGGER